MVTRCLFGLFVFGTNSSVIYRFLTDDLYEYLRQCFKTRGYKLNEDLTEDNQVNNNNDDELTLSIDDAMSQHLSVLIRVHEQTSSRHDPIRQIKLQSGIQVFFDQIAENNLICMADKSFDTIVILKAINLLKALIKFHIGVLPFIHYNVADQLINRISASLQYFLNNITTNQSILFEKLTVFMAYAPRYIIKECVQTCTSTNGMWGGSSIEVNCCASSLCNNASGLYFQYAWKNRFLFTIISSLFMTLLSII
ncbi:unnamed protein product [Rotaria sp. Silwood2]|nr:unnamed protein product [Rotaria sp. Silwood2]